MVFEIFENRTGASYIANKLTNVVFCVLCASNHSLNSIIVETLKRKTKIG